MRYYYFAATLPTVQMDGTVPFSLNDFRALCAEHLTACDLARLDVALAGDTDGTACSGLGDAEFAALWFSRETQIRNAATRWRAARGRRDAADFMRDFTGIDASIEKSVSECLGKENPLEREQALDILRWNILEELAGTDPFAAEAIFAYALKLRIAGRWATIESNDGRERAQALFPDLEDEKNGSREQPMREKS